ncbi:MAG: hypothetical protein AAGC55_09360 [Myxococcota bacterium]
MTFVGVGEDHPAASDLDRGRDADQALCKVAEALAQRQLLAREIRREAGTLDEFFVRVTDSSRVARQADSTTSGKASA